MIWHKTLGDRIHQFPIDQQLFMVANELNRAHHNQGDRAEYRNALERALEILDYFIGTLTHGNMIRESLRLRDLLAIAYQNPPQSTLALQKTLLQLNPQAWKQVAESFDSRENPAADIADDTDLK